MIHFRQRGAARIAAVLSGAAALIVGGFAFVATSTPASAHHVTSVQVVCNADGGVATVNVSGWTGDVILSNAAEQTPSGGSAVFTGLANGTYGLFREPDETDDATNSIGNTEDITGDNGGQQSFDVNCETPSPSPTLCGGENNDNAVALNDQNPCSTPTPETTPTASPSPTPTGCEPNADRSCETPPVVVVTVCSVDSTAEGGAISWSGADSKDSFTLFAAGIPNIVVSAAGDTTPSGSYGPLEGGAYTYQFMDNTNEIFNGSFTIARCVVPTPTPKPTPNGPPPVPSTGAGVGRG